jgi:hypothetical protein
VTITIIGLRNKLPGRDDIAMSAPARSAAGQKTQDTHRGPPQLADSAMVVIACHTPPHPKAYRHFLTCMGLERLETSAYPFR